MLPARFWKACYKVHFNNIPLPSRMYYSLSQTSRPSVLYFHFLAIWALGNNLRNAFLLAFPSIYLSQIMVQLGGSRMNGIYGAMGLIQDPLLESIHLWYT